MPDKPDTDNRKSNVSVGIENTFKMDINLDFFENHPIFLLYEQAARKKSNFFL